MNTVTTLRRPAATVLAWAASGLIALATDAARPRLLVLTDIGGDPDDQQSLVRLLVHANEFEIEGLIASASGTPGELQKKVTKPHLIREQIEAYGRVQSNLARHADGFPTAADLLKVVKTGSSNRGRQFVGAGQDTEGSRWIMACADKADARPLNISIWGGQTDFAQALWRMRADRGEAGLKEFQSRLRVFDVMDQDQIHNWLFAEFPGLFSVLAKAVPGEDKRLSAYRGMYLGGDESLTSHGWIDTNIRTGHGLLGALYPPNTWTKPNPHGALKEGDTPAWVLFLPNRHGAPAPPDWGGWGGRYERTSGGLYRDARDAVGQVTDARATVWRWREHFQNDFAARMDWCVADDFKRANHHPVAVLNGDKTRNIVEITAKPGDTVRLSAEGSRDPDDHAVEVRWWVYREAGSLRDEVKLSKTTGVDTSLVVPQIAQPGTLHVILEVCDDGVPKLWAYRRAVVRVEP